MRTLTMFMGAAALGLGLMAPIAVADHHEGGSTMAPSIGHAMIAQIKDAQDKLMELAEEFPADTYEWAPAEGVRTTAQTFLHVATANYGIPYLMGINPPEGIDPMALEKSTSKKAEVIKTLEASFEHVIAAFEATDPSVYGETVKFFDGSDRTKLDTMMIVVTHGHEHLGQLIAYARSNGIAPPWTARQNAQMEEARKKAAEQADE